MRSSTAAEMFALTNSGENQSLDDARIAVASEVGEESIPQPHGRRAARGILIGMLLGAGAWGAIWAVAAALWRHRG